MRGDISPLSQYAFMAWCLVKAQGQLYLSYFLQDIEESSFRGCDFKQRTEGLHP